MTKIKNIFRKSIEFIAARRLLSSSIIIVILLFPVGAVLTQKYLSNKENNIEKLEEQSSNTKENKKATTGKINTDAVFDKSVSKHTLSEGFQHYQMIITLAQMIVVQIMYQVIHHRV